MFPTLESNFRIPLIRHIIRLLALIPPGEQAGFQTFYGGDREMGRTEPAPLLSEVVLHPYYLGNPRIQTGSLLTACETGVPVLPMVISTDSPAA